MTWTRELFGTPKPIIAMLHLQALPGDPHYDERGGMRRVLDAAHRELVNLQAGGVDGILFSNEFSLPYLTRVAPATGAAMSRVIGELKKDIAVPYGVNVLWDPIASLDVAVATETAFVREVFTGVYASDFGLWNTNVGEVYRHRRHLGGGHIRLLFNIVPEAARYLADRSIEDIARSTVFNNCPDALCVSGLTAGSETDVQLLERVKRTVPQTVVLANTGVHLGNVAQQLAVADGAVVGTTFKREGVFDNEVDPRRVQAFMEKVRKVPGELDSYGFR